MSQNIPVIRYMVVHEQKPRKDKALQMRVSTSIMQIAHQSVNAEHELEKMIATHGNGLLRYCHSILLDYHEAQDVVQSTFIKAYAKVSAPNVSETHGAWLYRIAYTACIDIIRRKKLQRLFFSRHSAQEAATAPEYFISDNVNRILSELPPKDRALVFSRAVEGLDYKELVAIYGTNAASLRKRYERAKNKLAKTLEKGSVDNGAR
jgi:RNA polymerase sigma-70 factor (ECF subfamily)